MATYFHGNPEIQATSASSEGLQTLLLMNPTYVQYSSSPPPPPPAPPPSLPPPLPSNNLVFLNTTSNLSHGPPSTQQFVSIPLDPNSHDASTLHGLIPRIHYNPYSPIDSLQARETPRAQRGLSLSLSSQQHHGYGSQEQTVSVNDIRVSGGSVSSGSAVTYGISGLQGVSLSSKYLKAAQELLDEVVSVNNNEARSEFSKKSNGISNNDSRKVAGESSGAGDGYGEGEGGGKCGPELTTAERQEIQMKKAKLISMFDQVEQRYRQYHRQMHIVISSFEQAAGLGSARTYTALALQTISKQFRCLRDAITGQIKAANKSLGEEDSPTGKVEGSRLKFVDQQLRQQRALQQLGMIQHNAWRPQRGLPERSVSVLRAWLFEHFLHPYPKDSDKHLLAKQTGLTRSQVSNWFINARVRLWKPMVEEMYMEEIKEQEQNCSEDKTSKSEQNQDPTTKSVLEENSSVAVDKTKCFKSSENSLNHNASSAISMSSASTPTMAGDAGNLSGFSLIGSSELEGITRGSPKKPRGTDFMQSPTGVQAINTDVKPGDHDNNEVVSVKFCNDREDRDGYSFIGSQTNFTGGFGQYPIGAIGFDAEQFTPRFSGNGVSLTLGLPHSENLSLSGTHQAFLPNQNIQLGSRVEMGEANEFGTVNTSTSHSSAAYETINIQNRKRFAAQLLPDFVA